MGKCEFIIIKGPKKGLTCDIYTKQEINKKFYCKSHLKKITKPITKPIEENKTQDDVHDDVHDESIFAVDFDECDDLDSMINKTYEKTKNIKVDDNQSIKNCLHQVLNKLDVIENAILVKKHKYNPIDEIPEIKEFKL